MFKKVREKLKDNVLDIQASVGTDAPTPKTPGTHTPKNQVWLPAHEDPLAGLDCSSTCLTTGDVLGDGDWRLVVADAAKQLKVWRGTARESDLALVDEPCSVISYYADNNSPRLPALAVAVGSNVFIYRNMRPYFKFSLPYDSVDIQEQVAWAKLAEGSATAAQLAQSLQELAGAGTALTDRSRELLQLGEAGRQAAFATQWKGRPLAQQSCITCMASINQTLDEADSVACLVLGTEDERMMVLNPMGSQIIKNVPIGAVAAFISCTGVLEVEYRMAIVTREPKLLLLRNGELSGTILLDFLACDAVAGSKTIMVGCMDCSLHCYSWKGRRTFSLRLDAPIQTMAPVIPRHQRSQTCTAVGLANGEVHVYNGKSRVSCFTLGGPVACLYFGRYGREDNTLVSVTRQGALSIRILPRTANLEALEISQGPPPEQDIPLDIPPKTKAFVEQIEREQGDAAGIHLAYQQALLRLHLTTAQAYLRTVQDGQGPSASAPSAGGGELQLHAAVAGLGPFFRLRLTLQNTGVEGAGGLRVLLLYRPEEYRAERDSWPLPMLVPGLEYCFKVGIRCLQPATLSAGEVRVLIPSALSSTPRLSALVKMPMSEFDEL